MRVVDAARPRPGAGSAGRATNAVDDHPVHATVALAADLRRHLAAGLRRHRGLRTGFTPLVSRVPDTGTTQAALAEALGLSDQAVSGTLALAVDAGFVRRVPHPDDGRSKLVVLTDRGRALARHSGELIAERRDAHAAVVGHGRAEALVADLGTLYRSLARGGDTPLAPLREPDELGTIVPVAGAAARELHDAIVRAGHPEVRRAHASALLRIDADGVRPSGLARALGTSRQSAGASLAELEALGYVRRREADADRRAVVFTRTARADRFTSAWAAATDAVAARWREVLGDPRWARHTATLRDLHESLRAPGVVHGVRTAEADLDELAADLVRTLGITDARTLAHLLTEQTAPRTTHRRTRPTKEAGA